MNESLFCPVCKWWLGFDGGCHNPQCPEELADLRDEARATGAKPDDDYDIVFWD